MVTPCTQANIFTQMHNIFARYSNFKTFGSVVVKCPIEKTWETVGNAETWFRAVIGEGLVNLTVVKGNGRELGSKFNYFAKVPGTPGPPGRTQQRLIRLSDFDYNLVTTFDSSSLPLHPWTTHITLHRVTYTRKQVNYSLISFAQEGIITVPAERQAEVQQRVQSFFHDLFLPSLKARFDRCS